MSERYDGAHEVRIGHSDATYTDYLDEYIWAEMVQDGKVTHSPSDYTIQDGELVQSDGVDFRTPEAIMDECCRFDMEHSDYSHDIHPAIRDIFLQDVADRKAYLATCRLEDIADREYVADGLETFDYTDPRASLYSTHSAAYDIVAGASAEDLLGFEALGGDATRGAKVESKFDIDQHVKTKVGNLGLEGSRLSKAQLHPEYLGQDTMLTASEMKLASDDALVMSYLWSEAGIMETSNPLNPSVEGYAGVSASAEEYKRYSEQIRLECEARGITDFDQRCADRKAQIMNTDVDKIWQMGSAEYAVRVTQSRHDRDEATIAVADELSTYVPPKAETVHVKRGGKRNIAPEASAQQKLQHMRETKTESGLLSQDDFLTEAELKTLTDDDAFAVFGAAKLCRDISSDQVPFQETLFPSLPASYKEQADVYAGYYDLVCSTFEADGRDVVALTQRYNSTLASSSAKVKVEHMIANPMEFPPNDQLLNADELATLDDQALLEQFTLAKFCAGEKERWSHDHTLATENATDQVEVDMLAEGGDPGGDHPAYSAYYEAVKTECISRGYSVEQLERDSTNYISQAREASIESLSGIGVNIRFLSCMNDTNEQALCYYLTLSPLEREMEPRFKSVLTGPTIGASGAGRWDGARLDREPLQEKAGTISVTNGSEQHEYDIDLMAEMYPGTEYEVRTYSFYDNNGHHLMYCQSPYLGNFIYDGNDWGIGYKEIPGTEADNADGSLTKVPVLKYVGDVTADWQHGDSSPMGIWVNGGSFDDGLAAAGSNALNLVNSIDFLGIIPDSDDVGGYTNGQQVQIPYGVKNLDYTFENNDELQLIPGIPNSVESMHCTFMGCNEMYDASAQFGYDGQWHLPLHLKDASYTFQGCDELECKQIGTFPDDLLTIEGMFNGCEDILERPVWENWTLDLDAIFMDTKEADWSDSRWLREEFAKPIDENTSNTMKKNYEREEKERKEFQFEFTKPENLAKLSEEEREMYEDANAANAAVRTKKVADGEMTVRLIDEMSYNAPEKNEFKEFLNRAIVDVGTFAALKGVTGALTGSKLAGWVAGLGGTALLRMTDILPKSIEPVLTFVKGLLPDSAKAGMDKVIDWFHIPGEKEEVEAKREQMSRYAPVAIDDSIGRSAWSAAGIRDSAKVYESMRVNGQAVAEYGVLQYCGEEGRESTSSVKTTLGESIGQAEAVFDKQMQAEADGTGDGYDWPGTMKEYYWQLLYGLDGYNVGAQAGIASTYGGESDTLSENAKNGVKSLFGKGKNSEETQARMAASQAGLASLNCDYTSTVMESLVKMDQKYHFMEPEDWIKIGSLNIYGVDTSNLMYYQPGQILEPTYFDYNAPVVPSAYVQQETPTEVIPSTEPATPSFASTSMAELGQPESETETQVPVSSKQGKVDEETHDKRVKQAEALSSGIESNDQLENEAELSDRR